jgi:hypothetical protein
VNTPLTFSSANGNQVTVTDAWPGNTSDSLSVSVSHGTVTLGSTTGLTLIGGANGSSSFTVDGTIGNLNAALNGLTYQPTANYTGSDSLTFVMTDDATTFNTSASVALTVQSLVPFFSFPFGPAITMPENGLFRSPLSAPFVNMGDYGGTAENLTMTASHGQIAVGTTTGLTVTGNGTASVNLIGSINNIDNALGQLFYQPATNYVGTDTLNFSDTDTTTGITGTASATITIVGFAVNAPASASTTQNTAVTFSSANGNQITVTDAFSNPSDGVSVTVSNGTVTLGSTTGLTFTSGANGTASFSVSGTLGNLNAALNGLTYQPNANYTGSDSMLVILGDFTYSINTGSTVALTVNAVGAPSIAAPSTATVSENASLVFSSGNGNAVTVSDNAAGTNADSMTLSVANGTLMLGSTNGLIFTSGSNGSATFTVKGTVSNLNNALSGLTYTPTANYAGSDSLAIQVSDPGDGKSGSTSVAITVSPLAPTISSPTTAAVNQNGSLVFSSGNGDAITVTDAGPGGDSLALSVSHGTLTLATTTGLTFTTGSNGTASFTVTGTVANLNAALNGLTYRPTAAYTGPDTLAVSLTDTGDSLSASKNVAISVNALAAPSITAPASASVIQNGSLVFSSGNGNTISVSDAAAGSNSDSLTLSVTHGTLTLSTTAGLTFTTGTNGTASFTVTGTVASLNAALSGLTYAPTAGYTGSDSLAISIIDPGDSQSASKNVALTVNAFSPPTISAPSAATVPMNGSIAFSAGNSDAITVADSGPGSDSLTLSVSHGTLTLSTVSGLTFTAGSNGSASFSVTGSIASLNAALSGLIYAPTAGYTGSDTLSAAIHDTADGLSASTSVALTVTSGGGAPSITAPSSLKLYYKSTLVFSPATGKAITINDASAGTSIQQLTLSATHGTLKLGSTTGITFVNGANNSASMTIDGTLANLNTALNGLTFTPTPFFTGTAVVTLGYTDLGTGLMGSATITILVVNNQFGNGGGTGPSTPATQTAPVSSPSAGGTTPASTSKVAGGTVHTDSSPPVDDETHLAGFTAALQLLMS